MGLNMFFFSLLVLCFFRFADVLRRRPALSLLL